MGETIMEYWLNYYNIKTSTNGGGFIDIDDNL
jgi:hypothetical protein